MKQTKQVVLVAAMAVASVVAFGAYTYSYKAELVEPKPSIQGIEVIRGPYLQSGTPNSVIVKWRTNDPETSIVHYGTSADKLDKEATTANPTTEHEVFIGDLKPNTTYYYSLADSKGEFKKQTGQHFRTSPVVGSKQKIRVWALGDCGSGNKDQRNVRDAYYKYVKNLPADDNHTDMILLLGDNAYERGTDRQYQRAIFETYQYMLKQTVTWSTMGNHDGYSANAEKQTGPYYDIFTFPTKGEAGGLPSGTEAYYSYNYGNIHFIILDSHQSDRSVGGAMYNWAKADLENTNADWIVAVWHHPAYSKGSHDSDRDKRMTQMRENFNPLMESYGVDLVLSGHSHSYERSYLLNGHYGYSDSFDPGKYTVGATGGGDGREDGNGAYLKTTEGADAGKGAVYINAGSSGKHSGGSLDHPAMYISLDKMGSCSLEVEADTLRLLFLRDNGEVDDHFTIVKNN